MTKQTTKQRTYWAAKRRFNPRMMGRMPDRWWTDVRKAVFDVLVRSSDHMGACSISLHEIANRAFTTRGNASKIIKALEQHAVLRVKRERIRGKYKSEQNAYCFADAVWALVSPMRTAKHTTVYPPEQQALDLCQSTGQPSTVDPTADRVGAPVSKPVQPCLQDSCKETDNINNNNPHKGIKKTSYIPTKDQADDQAVSCQEPDNSKQVVSLKQVGNKKHNYIFNKQTLEVDCTTHPPCGNAIMGVVYSHGTTKNRPNGLCGWNASSMSPPVRSQHVDTPSKYFSREKCFWSKSTYHIRDKIVFGLAQFDQSVADRFAHTHTAGDVLALLQRLRSAYLPTIPPDKLENLFWKVKDGRYLAMRVVVHFVNTMCKVHFVREGDVGTIRTTPERFFLGTLGKWRPPTIDQLLDSLDRMAAENDSRYTMTISERYTMYRQQREQAEQRQRLEKIYDVVLDCTLDKVTFRDIMDRMRNIYGHAAWDNWLSKVKLTDSGITAPRSCIAFVRKHYLARITLLVKAEGVVYEPPTIYHRQKEQGYDVLLDCNINKVTFSYIMGKMRSEYGNAAWENWLSNIKRIDSGIIAPSACVAFIRRLYLDRITTLVSTHWG